MSITTSIRVPPDSTGSRVLTTKRSIIEWDQGNNQVSFATGQVVTGTVSGATGTITGIITSGYSANAGRLYIDNVVGGPFDNNEPLQVMAIQYGISNLENLNSDTQEDVHIQSVALVDPDNPSYKQKIDRFGATLNTFTDGSPIFSAFGELIVGNRFTIKSYRFAYDNQNHLFQDDILSGSTITYESTTGTCLLTNPTTNGAKSVRTSHFYHPYLPGIGQSVDITVAIGDVGKTNVVRRWGYFDGDNGAFWELDGTNLYVVLRSNTSGVVVDNRIPQSQFNIDKLDGSDDLGFNIDVTVGNIYQIELQWLGAGKVSFSVVESSGSKLRAHTFMNANINNLPYMRTCTLPMRVEQQNVGTSASSSEMRLGCCSIQHNSTPYIDGRTFTRISKTITANTPGTETALIGIRPKITHNGIGNHAISHIRNVQVMSDPSATGSTIVRQRQTSSVYTNVANSSFANVSTTNSMMQLDYNGEDYSDSDPNESQGDSCILLPGESYTFTHGHEDNHLHTGEIFNDADLTQNEFYITVENLGSGTANCTCVVSWEELLL